VTVGHLHELVAKISRGDVVPLVARLLRDQTLSEEQIVQLETLVAEAQRRSRADKTQGRKR
jgi:hypothetical protein